MMNANELIDKLENTVKEQVAFCQSLSTHSKESLTKKQTIDKWNALECIEHLRRYAAFYIPAIKEAQNNSSTTAKEVFISTWLGNYFVKQMEPKSQGKGMKTFKSKNPLNAELSPDVIDTFIVQLKELIILLKSARDLDLTRTKVQTTLPLIKFNLGDTFRFVIMHNERHLAQAAKAMTIY